MSLQHFDASARAARDGNVGVAVREGGREGGREGEVSIKNPWRGILR